MSKTSTHPDALIEFLNGRVDEATRQEIEPHLSTCPECSAVAETIKALRLERDLIHPDISEIASLLHGGLSEERESAVSAHVACCRSCASEVAQYARAEAIAAKYDSSNAPAAEIPAAAWQAIREWEESSYGIPRSLSEVAAHDLPNRLSRLLSERNEEMRELITRESKVNLVPVIVVSADGEFKGIELFEALTESGGANILRHADRSDRFDSRPVHVLLDLEDRQSVLVSERVDGQIVRLEKVLASEPLKKVNYFIVED